MLTLLFVAGVGLGKPSSSDECGSGAGCAPPVVKTVPDVRNIQIPYACSILAEEGFRGIVRKAAYRDDLAARVVVTTDPAADTAREGGRVLMYVNRPREIRCA